MPGPIQSSINQAVGTTLGAVAAGKHVSEQKKANELAQENKELTSVYNFNMAQSDYQKAVKEESALVDEEIKRQADEEEYQIQASTHEALAGERNKMSPQAFDLIYGEKAFQESEKRLIAERKRLDLQGKTMPKRLAEAQHRTYQTELTRGHAFDMLSEEAKKKITGGKE